MKYINFFTIRKYIYNSLYLLTKIFYRNYVSILCFHEVGSTKNRYVVTKNNFQKIIAKIARTSNFISVDDLFNKNVQDSNVLITFDDGYKNLLEIVPIIKKYNIKPIVFVLSDSKKANRKELDNKSPLLSIKDIKYLHANGFTIGSHSATHADLTKINNDQLVEEITKSKKQLEKDLGLKIDYLAYPKGKYNKQIINMVKKAGYKAAFSIEPGNVNIVNNKFILPRTIIDCTHTIEEFPAVYSPSAFKFRNLTNRLNIWERFLA